MTNMSNLPRDLVEEILSRVPVKYRRAVRFTCKKWNTLTKQDSFVKKHVSQPKVASAKAKEFLVIMIMGFRVYLTSVNLHSNVIKHEAKFTSLDDSDVLDVVRVIHCDGLLLYIIKNNAKGNTYWFATTRDGPDCLILSFDFTRERFGLPLSMPFELWKPTDLVTLSIVREEELVVLRQRSDTFMMEFWITTKIEPNTGSWNIKVFLAVNMRPLSYFDFEFIFMDSNFFIDEEKKVAVVFDKNRRVSPICALMFQVLCSFS